MRPELAENYQRAVRWEKRSRVLWFVASLVAVVSSGSGYLYYGWKSRQLAAAGLWPMQYGEAFTPLACGVMLAVFSGLLALHFFVDWLHSVRDRRRLLETCPELWIHED